MATDVEPVAAYVPYMTSQGNHERAYNFSHYAERFTMPGHGARTGNAYYSFDLGPLHVVAFNAEAFFWPEYFDEAYMSRMYEWLVTDLRAANDDRANTPWVMVHGHRPMYCVDPKVPDLTPHANKPEFAGVCGWEKQAVRKGVASECEDEYAALGCSASNARESTRGSSTAARPRRAGGASPEGLRKASGESSGDFPIEKLLFDAGVDLYLAGHVHDYERYFPVYDEHVVNGTDVTLGRYVNPGATVHVTSGSGGNPEMWTDGMYNASGIRNVRRHAGLARTGRRGARFRAGSRPSARALGTCTTLRTRASRFTTMRPWSGSRCPRPRGLWRGMGKRQSARSSTGSSSPRRRTGRSRAERGEDRDGVTDEGGDCTVRFFERTVTHCVRL